MMAKKMECMKKLMDMCPPEMLSKKIEMLEGCVKNMDKMKGCMSEEDMQWMKECLEKAKASQ